MTDADLVAATALVASALTGTFSLGVAGFQHWLQARSSDKATVEAAIVELLTRSGAYALRGRALGEAMRQRSGLKEGIDVATHLRKPADLMEFHDWMAQDLTPMQAALSQLWTLWSDQQGIALANDVVSKASDLLGAQAITPATSGKERARRFVFGERWTEEAIAESQRALDALAQARKKLAEHARLKLGRKAANLFAQVEADDAGEAAQSVEPAGEAAAQHELPGHLAVSEAAPDG
jgi:hypothetical protein